MNRTAAPLLIICLTLSACATVTPPYVPVVDRPGPTYAVDLVECQALAAQRDPVASAGAGLAAGAVIGGLLGAAIGGRSGATLGAQVGAIQGGAGGAVHGVVMQRAVVMSCLIGRGHRVLA